VGLVIRWAGGVIPYRLAEDRFDISMEASNLPGPRAIIVLDLHKSHPMPLIEEI